MRTSFLSRSVIAAASLAVGSVTMAATPASAAGPSDITRDMVLTAVDGVRAAPLAEPGVYPDATLRALTVLSNHACSVDNSIELVVGALAVPAAEGKNADGLAVTAVVVPRDFDGESGPRACIFGALAATDAAYPLRGMATFLAGPTTQKSELSGGVFVTTPHVTTDQDAPLPSTRFTASGTADRPFTVATSKRVADKKTKAQKQVAKRKYDWRIAAAKKSYRAALVKAGHSTSKKAAAKKSYSRQRATARYTYEYAIAGHKLVPGTATKVDSRPFALSISTIFQFS